MKLDDHIMAAQHAAEARLAFCNALLWVDEGSADMEGLEVSEPSAPYCGCDTCVVREVLDSAWPHIIAAAKLVMAIDVRPDDEIGSNGSSPREE